MTNILSLSVIAYAKNDTKLFDYVADVDSIPELGSICEVNFNNRTSLAIVRKISTSTSFSDKLKPIERFIDIEPVPNYLLQLSDWLIEYYSATCRSVWQTILPSGIKQKSRPLKRADSKTNTAEEVMSLSVQQQNAVESILASSQPSLLFGVTGSGKTEVYINLIADALKNNRSTILLVPEIIMTPQMIEQLSKRFSKNLIITHSKLTAAQRKRAWLDCLSSDSPRVIIGPRSALFMPLRDLGLIIIDEEHEQSYKQEQSPRYHANYVAAELAKLTDSKLVLGSATPSLQSFWLTQQGRINLVRMPERVDKVDLPAVTIEDLSNKHEILNYNLITTMKRHLRSGKQVILFLNRRGSALALLCQSCGHSVHCPNCETSLTFHADSARLRCHYCGFAQLPPALCPHCEKDDLQYIGTGTKGIEEKIMKLFHDYKIERLDRDNSDLDHIEAVYSSMKSGETNILIGTQMVARGLDIDGVEFVGVLLADGMLNIPDFSASERTFQLLTQVAGRAGRKSSNGEAIIQTYLPSHPAIVDASHHNYEAFYEKELVIREKYGYPPFCYLAKLSYGHKISSIAQKTADELSRQLVRGHHVTVLGPVQNFIPRSGGKYWFQIILKAKNRSQLVKIAHDLKPGWTIDLDPINLI